MMGTIKATHVGKETEEFYAAEYVVDCDSCIIAYRFLKSNLDFWIQVDKTKSVWQVFPDVNTLIELPKSKH